MRSALIHTLHFGNHYRSAVNGKSYLAFNNTRGPANAPILIPMMGENDEGSREHYLTFLVQHQRRALRRRKSSSHWARGAGAAAHRIGNRYLDLKELGHDQNNPADV